jgi:hypothetical protein
MWPPNFDVFHYYSLTALEILKVNPKNKFLATPLIRPAILQVKAPGLHITNEYNRHAKNSSHCSLAKHRSIGHKSYSESDVTDSSRNVRRVFEFNYDGESSAARL